jgi:hypothetical protein
VVCQKGKNLNLFLPGIAPLQAFDRLIHSSAVEQGLWFWARLLPDRRGGEAGTDISRYRLQWLSGCSQRQLRSGHSGYASECRLEGHFLSNPHTNGPIKGLVLANNKSAHDRVAMGRVAKCGSTAENPGSAQGLGDGFNW